MKAQISELYNVLVGCVLLFIGFLVFIGIQSQISNIAEQEVSDLHTIDSASSYLPVISKINAEQYEQLLNVSRRINSEQETKFFSGNVEIFETGVSGQLGDGRQVSRDDMFEYHTGEGEGDLVGVPISMYVYFYSIDESRMLRFVPIYAINALTREECERRGAINACLSYETIRGALE